MNSYEGVFIAKSGLTDEANQKLLSQIEGEITKNGGKVDNSQSWGKKTIAYPIKKNKEGLFYKLDFTVEPGKMSEIKKAYGLSDDILRVTIIKKGK